MLTDVIHKQLGPSINIELSPNWGSNNLDHRQLIRENIKSQLSEYLNLPTLDLNNRPRLNTRNGTLSISHSKTLGGYVYSLTESLGLDIEQIQRINDRIVSRISTSEEFKIGLSNAELWTIKESSFKSISNSGIKPDIKTVSEIIINKKTPIKTDLIEFTNFTLSSASAKNNSMVEAKSLSFYSHQYAVQIAICNTRWLKL
jgi:phosphopantetheinyl transferase